MEKEILKAAVELIKAWDKAEMEVSEYYFKAVIQPYIDKLEEALKPQLDSKRAQNNFPEIVSDYMTRTYKK